MCQKRLLQVCVPRRINYKKWQMRKKSAKNWNRKETLYKNADRTDEPQTLQHREYGSLTSTLVYGVKTLAISKLSQIRAFDVDNEANVENKRYKMCYKRRDVTICRNEQVVVRHRSNLEAIVFGHIMRHDPLHRDLIEGMVQPLKAKRSWRSTAGNVNRHTTQ